MIEYLVRQIAVSDSNSVLQQTEQMLNKVIFEADVDEVHYYLVRCPPRSNEQINLSPREQAIAKLVAQGLPNKSIGNQLNISPWTVATYLRLIFLN